MICKKIFDRAGWNALLFAITVVLVSGLFPSCSGNKTDVSELLSTIPADASAVAAVNVKSIVEKTGCTIDGSKIVPGKEMEKIIYAQTDSRDAALIKSLLGGEAGVDPSAVVFFIEGNDRYITGFVADPAKFREFVAKACKEEIVSEKGIDKCSNIALKGNQFWIRASHNNDIDTDQIDRFSSLDDKLSFLSNPFSSSLSSISHDIEGWGNISSLYSASGMSFQEKTIAGLAMAILFSDAQDMAFSADFNDGAFLCSLKVLNSKGAAAKFNLPVDRIDPSVVASLPTSADMIFAMALSPKFVEQLKKEAGRSNIPGGEEILSALSALDGTCVVATDSVGLRGILSTTGENSAALSEMISSTFGATVTKDGKTLRFEKGDVKGALEPAAISKNFKGAMAAVTVSGAAENWLGNQPFTSLSAMLVPVEGSMEIDMEVKSDAPKENILITFLKSSNQQ